MSKLALLRAERLKRRKRRKILRIMLRTVSITALVFLGAFLVLDYFDRIPFDTGKEKTENSVFSSSEEGSVAETSTAGTSEIVLKETTAESSETTVSVSSSDSTSDHENTVYEDTEADPAGMILGMYENPGIIICDSKFVNIRRSASSDADIVGKAMNYAVFEVLSTDGEWAHISSEGHEGYVSQNFVKKNEEVYDLINEHCRTYAYAYLNKVRAYEKPDEKSDVVFRMFAENGYEVLEKGEDWVLILTNENEKGYVEKKNVSIRYSSEVPYFFEAGEELSSVRRNLLDYAFSWYGGAYVWGGVTLGVGVDCSGYCLRVFEHFGIEIPRLSADQAQWGQAVSSIEEAKPGDLLFFRGYYDNGVLSEGVGHVGIYIGNQKMIHAASKERGIIVDTYNYMEEPLCIRRVIND